MPFLCPTLPAVLLLLTAAESPASLPAPAGLPAAILATGTAQAELRAYLLSRAKPFELPDSLEQWERQSDQLRARMLSEVIFRGVPQQWREEPTHVEWQEHLPGKGYRIRKLRFQVVPGLWVGGLLYEPGGLSGKTPVILNVNGHEPTGLFTDYIQARSINLAKRGMLVLALDWIGTGQLRTPGFAHNNQCYLDLCGAAGVSIMYLELQRGLDVLQQQPHADPDRLAVTGMSGGGWQTILISALDTRVKLCAPNAGYTSVQARIQNPPDMGDYEQCPPDLSAVADYTYLTAMLAPRPALLIYNDKDQCCFRGDRSRIAIFDPIVPAYGLYNQTQRFAFHMNSDPGTHNYLEDNREAFYRFVHRHFAPDAGWSDKDIPVLDEIPERARLEIDYPEDNADFLTLARGLMKDLPRPSESLHNLRGQVRAVIRPSSTPLAATTEPAGPTTRAAGIEAQEETFLLKLGNRWTLPVLLLTPPGAPDGVDIVLADSGRDKLSAAAFESTLRAGRRVMLVDLLMLGECNRLDIHRYLWSNLLNTVGDRPLGIQVDQLAAVIEWARGRFATRSLRIVAHGRMASMAALAFGALQPGQLEVIETNQLERSLKDVLAAKVIYEDAPSIFCPGLFKLADLADLVRLAQPTKVTFAP